MTDIVEYGPRQWLLRSLWLNAVSIEHEAPIELCQRHPQLVPKLLGMLGDPLP